MAVKVMLIRHGEKPADDNSIRGVDAAGNPSKDELTVRGWQRAGALARLFAPFDDQRPRPGLAVPTVLYAPATTGAVQSKRSKHTLLPTAKLLSLVIRTHIEKGREADLVQELLSTEGVALVCWAHQGLPAIASGLLGASRHAPAAWPEERFDLVWTIDLAGGQPVFGQTAQLVLPGDSAEFAPP